MLLLSIMMLTSVGTWARGEGSGDPPTPTEVSVTTATDLKNALESETISTISMKESITLTEQIIVGADHTLSIAASKTLTCTGEGGIWVDNNISLTIQGGEGSRLVCGETSNRSTIGGTTLTLNNITVDITSGIIDPTYLTVGTGATINVGAENQDSPLQISKLTVDNGGTININKFTRIGINIGTALTINSGGTVKVGNGAGDNQGIFISSGASIVLNDGGTLEGTGEEDKGGNIYLAQNAKVTGMSGKLVDRGNELNVSSEPVTVVAENAEPSTTSLSQGLYTWDKSSSKFAKPDLEEGYTLSESGALTISSQIGMTNWVKHGRGNATIVTSVTITGDVTEIIMNAFSGCSNLTQVTITATGITSIGASAFQRTTSLTMIEIPASVTTIGNAAFSGSGISKFTVAEGDSSFKTDTDGKALLTYDGKTLVLFAPKATGSYTIPDGVETIGPYSFESSALDSLKILSSVKTIGESAFYLSDLISIVIGEAVETIGAMVFFRSALTSIVIPESVETIGEGAFSQSSALTTVTFEGETAPTIEAGIFAFCDNLASILVPANAAGYTGDGASDNWKAWAQYIKAGQTQTTGNNTVSPGGTLIGNGQTTADKVTPLGNATLENVKTQATEVAANTTSEITLTGSNELGAITVGSGGSLTLLTANEGTRVTVTSVANSGTFTDNTGSVTEVTGAASLNLSAVDAMPSDQTATGRVTLTAKPVVAQDADVSYQWQKQENGTWTNVSNPYTRATVTGSPDFTTSISGRYRCQIKVEKNSVSTTLHTRPATATVKSTPDPEPEPTPTYYTVTLPSVEGAVTDPVAGSYDVESWSTFRFYLTLADDYNQSVPIVTTSRGEVIEPRTSDGAYLVKYVRTDVPLSIDGIVKNPPPVANAELQSGTRIFTRNGSLFITTDRPTEAQIFALTGQLIRSLALPAGETRVDGLADGIYIVRLSDGTVQKVVVRK